MRNERGSALIMVLGLAVVAGIAVVLIMSTSRASAKRTGGHRGKISALNIAEAGKDHMISMITAATFTPVANQCSTALKNVNFGGGRYTVTCCSTSTPNTVVIRSQGWDKSGASKRIEVILSILLNPPISATGVRGAVTSRTTVRMNGNIEADGRNWDSTNTGIIDPGLYGVSSCGAIIQQSNSVTIGGNGLDPAKNAVSPRIEENVPLSNVPSTIEQMLGMTTEQLEAYRVKTLPPAPFHGIYYLDGNVGPVHFGDFSSGIIIVHNTTSSAVLHANNGYFKGLIITDLLDKINGNLQVLGGVFTLRDGADVETFVTGTATIRYSSQVLNNLHNYVQNNRRQVQVVSWQEIPAN